MFFSRLLPGPSIPAKELVHAGSTSAGHDAEICSPNYQRPHTDTVLMLHILQFRNGKLWVLFTDQQFLGSKISLDFFLNPGMYRLCLLHAQV